MPNIKGKPIAPEVAFQRGFCPETGVPLDEIEDIEGHILHLWPGARSPEAVQRIAMLRAHAADK